MSNMFTVSSFIADDFGMKTPALGLIYYPVTNKEYGERFLHGAAYGSAVYGFSEAT